VVWNPEVIVAFVTRQTHEGDTPVKLFFVPLVSLFLLDGCAATLDRNVRAFNTCVARHPDDVVVCQAAWQAYEVGVPTYAARSLPETAVAQ
jgi:hypothetical protein